ncbi:MAG: carboxypeptidase-like regulatory domain-containing protein [Candidatus Bathyarchaeota archaeon]|nr:carboxypeptidase-like regulatory domain-containing protein [Candidatus Bathyarchaeum tardum]
MKTSLHVLLFTFWMCTVVFSAPIFGLPVNQEVPVTNQLQVNTISEGYILSTDSNYETYDRYYIENEKLYVWVWSSKLDPYNIGDHYCQLTLDKYVHKFYLNYDQNMSQPNSFTGSFDLSRLEKSGDWAVQIYLRTSPPKPETFEENDVIHVLEQAPQTHLLTVSSLPISDVIFTLNGTNWITQFSSSVKEAAYTIVMPPNVTVNKKTYDFLEWENGATLQTRTINLTDDRFVTAYYVAQNETFSSTITGIVTDNLGNPIPSAKVTIIETKNFTFTVSDPAGQYLFENLSEGIYTLKVEAEGYNTTLTALAVEPNNDHTQNFALSSATTKDEGGELEAWQIGLVVLTLIGATMLLMLWRSRKRFMKKIKKTEYKKSLEKVRLNASLQELKDLRQKGLLSEKAYEEMQKQLKEDLAKIMETKN